MNTSMIKEVPRELFYALKQAWGIKNAWQRKRQTLNRRVWVDPTSQLSE